MSDVGHLPSPTVGLCGACRHRRVTGNRLGSRFYLCGRSRHDSRYPKYPPLPVLTCDGFEAFEETTRREDPE